MVEYRKIEMQCNCLWSGNRAERDKRFIDLDGMKADYKYGLQNATHDEKEEGKLNRGQIVNNNSTDYAIKLLQEEIKKNNIILLSYNEKILKYIIDNKIKYCLVYAGKNLAKEYAKRMKKRGNSINFIEKMTNNDIWLQFYINNSNDATATYKVELRKGQYLSDIKNMFLN